MDIFDMVKAAPPPQTINPVESKMSTPSPIPPDSPLDAIDLLESGIISNEDDLDKEATLDESPFQIPKRKPDDTCQNIDESPFTIPKRLKKFEEDIEELEKAMGNISNRIEKQPEEDNTPSKKLKKSDESPKTTAKPAKTKKSAVADKTADTYPFKHHKKRPTEDVQDEGDEEKTEEKSEEDQLLTAMPTKTKAQQKMFSDQLLAKPNFDRVCVVRVRRLTQQEIDSAFESVANSPFAHVVDSPQAGVSKGRGRAKNAPSPPKKHKSPPKHNFHIKVPLQNGTKKRTLQHLARTHTPPPSLARRVVPQKVQVPAKAKANPKPKSKTKPIQRRHASQALIQRFGARFFGCVVKIKRTPWPSKWPECSPRPIGGVKKGRSRKSNLSVSFSEAVEILGSSDSSSRRATFGSISSKSPKPTRLQRVDATGNVLEDIALTSTPLPLPPAGSSSSASPRGKNKRRSCNGSPMGGRLKRPHQRLSLSSLASLRLDDDPKAAEDEDEEYIVPNELPGIQRPGTPPPKKKKISFTTTISDDEDEKPVVNKEKDILKKSAKPLKETPNKKVDKAPKEKEKSDKSLKEKEKTEKSNEIVEDKIPLIAAEVEAANKEEIKPTEEETQSKKEENEIDADATNEVERDREAQDAADEKRNLSSEDKQEEKVDDKPVETAEETTDDKPEETPAETEEKAAQEETVENLDKETAEEITENLNESPQKPTEEVKLKEVEEEVEQAEELRELASSPQLLSTTEDNQEDVLEIQTSLDDVRQLHTPSSRQSTPKPRSRQDSGESDCSFKSASDHDKQAAGVAAEAAVEEEGKPAEAEEEAPAAPIIDDTLNPGELPAELMTPPSTTRTLNGSNPTSGSSVSGPFYSPLEQMPTLDDEVLGQLDDFK
ncbi:muscle M-line assembly protein unc-89 isoform X2 [Drosophila rhopaloa]|uniref:Muscle M-line assembly protein unc-89 isoform X2 n=1 Tax=Drosophila rhopaloa TaxID=1041015 RepID=A0A6P4F9X8_DRORH|nr:muscle M-line assembly protein unc-89 isoform X2 [Drosophila rhopaloa]